MKKRSSFPSYAAAQEFAKHNAPSRIQRADGCFLVSYDGPDEDKDSENEREAYLISCLANERSARQALEVECSNLRDQVSELESSVEKKIAKKRTELQKKHIALEEELKQRQQAEKQQLMEERRSAGRKREHFSSSLERIEEDFLLITNSLQQKFGRFNVEDYAIRTQDTFFCSRCGGDGGVSGGCKQCDGTGWELRDVLKPGRRVVFE